MPLHHLGLDFGLRHLRQIGRPEIGVSRGRGFLAPLLPGLVLLVVNDIVKIVRYVDASLRRGFGFANRFKAMRKEEEEEEENGYVFRHGFGGFVLCEKLRMVGVLLF